MKNFTYKYLFVFDIEKGRPASGKTDLNMEPRPGPVVIRMRKVKVVFIIMALVSTINLENSLESLPIEVTKNEETVFSPNKKATDQEHRNISILFHHHIILKCQA